MPATKLGGGLVIILFYKFSMLIFNNKVPTFLQWLRPATCLQCLRKRQPWHHSTAECDILLNAAGYAVPAQEEEEKEDEQLPSPISAQNVSLSPPSIRTA
jgi:hypothetical protein